MELKLTGPKTLILPSPAVAYILDKLAKCPFNEVQQLIGDIFQQLKIQEIQDEAVHGTGTDECDFGVQSVGPTDR
jgi:hypothetical protein